MLWKYAPVMWGLVLGEEEAWLRRRRSGAATKAAFLSGRSIIGGQLSLIDFFVQPVAFSYYMLLHSQTLFCLLVRFICEEKTILHFV